MSRKRAGFRVEETPATVKVAGVVTAPEASVRGQVKVVITREVWDKVMAVTRLWDKEVGGILEVEQRGRTLHVKGLVGAKQTTGPGDVDFDEFTFKEFLEGKGWWGVELPTAVWGIWHSHVNMGVFASGTDEEMIRRFVSRGYLVNLIVNKKGEGLVRVDSMAGGDTEGEALHVTIPSTWEVEIEEKWKEWAEEYVKTFIQERKVQVTKWVPEGRRVWETPHGGYFGEGAFFEPAFEPTYETTKGEDKRLPLLGEMGVEEILRAAKKNGWDKDTIVRIARNHCKVSNDASDDECVRVWWMEFLGD